MDRFQYEHNLLHCENVPLPTIADEFGTPTYVYSQRAFVDHYERLSRAFAPLRPKICFSVKSCHNIHVLRLLRECGASFDAVSGNEVRRAIEAGADPADIVFAGVGKTDEDIAAAIDLGVGCLNVESVAELENIGAHAERADKRVRVALRVNPDVDAGTHPHTTTGKRENKFGIDIEQVGELFRRFTGHKRLSVSGVHIHIGSPVNTIDPYVRAITRTLSLIDDLRANGARIDLVNIGGGYGVCYQDGGAPQAEHYARAIVPLLADRGLQVCMEPGRFISANASVLLTRTIYVKQGLERCFVIVDAAMTDLIRPALYGAEHFIWPVQPAGGLVPPHRSTEQELPGTNKVDVVGPVCESGDFLGRDRWLPPIQRGDLIAVFSAGAYGAVMSSQYNSRTRAAEVLVHDRSARLIRRRETYDDLVAPERDV